MYSEAGGTYHRSELGGTTIACALYPQRTATCAKPAPAPPQHHHSTRIVAPAAAPLPVQSFDISISRFGSCRAFAVYLPACLPATSCASLRIVPACRLTIKRDTIIRISSQLQATLLSLESVAKAAVSHFVTLTVEPCLVIEDRDQSYYTFMEPAYNSRIQRPLPRT
ncbi:hypothetical protein CHU98_g6841 [Xylaria longipes]|nr:hypothetical protein CHU98_g6841 [Xylaria longipes]